MTHQAPQIELPDGTVKDGKVPVAIWANPQHIGVYLEFLADINIWKILGFPHETIIKYLL